MQVHKMSYFWPWIITRTRFLSTGRTSVLITQRLFPPIVEFFQKKDVKGRVALVDATGQPSLDPLKPWGRPSVIRFYAARETSPLPARRTPIMKIYRDKGRRACRVSHCTPHTYVRGSHLRITLSHIQIPGKLKRPANIHIYVRGLYIFITSDRIWLVRPLPCMNINNSWELANGNNSSTWRTLWEE